LNNGGGNLNRGRRTDLKTDDAGNTDERVYAAPLRSCSPASRTTVTGQGAWPTQWWLTDPMSMPVNAP
jgi:hypothetical protein